MARNVTMANLGFLNGCGYLLHDREAKFCVGFDEVLAAMGLKVLKLPPRSPDLNALLERWNRSIKEECLDQLIPFGERHFRRAVAEFVAHYQCERNHQGLGNELIELSPAHEHIGRIRRRSRLGGLLNYYARAA